MHLLERADQARVWIAGFGPLAPLAYICLNTAQVVVAPFPGNFMGVVSGYLFGIFWGTLYSIIGLSIGATIAICIGRFLGRPILVRFFDECSLREWEGKLRMRSPALWALVFLFPVPDLLIYMAGMSSVPLRWLLPAIVFGRGIGIMLANIVGGWSAKLPPEWLLVKWIVLTAIALIVFQYQRDIRLYLLLGYRRLRRLTRRSFWTLSGFGAPNTVVTFYLCLWNGRLVRIRRLISLNVKRVCANRGGVGQDTTPICAHPDRQRPSSFSLGRPVSQSCS